jgi:hypothetical protein
VILLLQAAGDDADHAGMPAFAADDDDACVRLLTKATVGLLHRLLLDARLDFLALGILGVKFLGELDGLGAIIGGEQARGCPRITDAAAGVEARAEHEGCVVD